MSTIHSPQGSAKNSHTRRTAGNVGYGRGSLRHSPDGGGGGGSSSDNSDNNDPFFPHGHGRATVRNSRPVLRHASPECNYNDFLRFTDMFNRKEKLTT